MRWVALYLNHCYRTTSGPKTTTVSITATLLITSKRAFMILHSATTKY